jgi:pimeloyl-ACP methyl ester carboxylesterase
MAATPTGRSTLPGLDGRSRWIDLDGPVHYLDLGGPAAAPVIVCVHGLGGSSVNWSALAPLLTDRFRLFAPDLAGHGLTRSIGRGATVTDNRRLLHRFIESVPGAPVILMGNSMGGLISLAEAVAAPGVVTDLVLVAPALPFVPARPDPGVTAMLMAYSTPILGQVMVARRRRMSPEDQVRSTLTLCCADPSRVPAHIVAEHVAVARRRTAFPEINRDLNAAGRSTVTTAVRRLGAPYRRAIRSVTAPVLLLYGERDRLVPPAAARATARANPSWSVRALPDSGHIPHVETPEVVAGAVKDWLDR